MLFEPKSIGVSSHGLQCLALNRAADAFERVERHREHSSSPPAPVPSRHHRLQTALVVRPRQVGVISEKGKPSAAHISTARTLDHRSSPFCGTTAYRNGQRSQQGRKELHLAKTTNTPTATEFHLSEGRIYTPTSRRRRRRSIVSFSLIISPNS